MEHSKNQLEFFEVLEKTKYNICIDSTAGSGKTTTILEGLKRVPKFSRTIFLSFSNTIVNELREKVPQGIPAQTLHSLGYGFLRNSYPSIKLEENKYFLKALNTFFPDKKERDKNSFRDCFRIQDVCSFIRMTLTPLSTEKIESMCNYYNLDYTRDIIDKSIILISTKEKFINIIDFVDMIYLPVTLSGIITRKYDHVFLDEAQDLNKCQQKFVESILTDNGRLISVGDSYQSIFSFSGANIDSFEQLQKRANTVTLSLPTSYRCPKNVVIEAQKVCEKIQFHEEKEEGVVRYGDVSEIEAGDLVISRITAPLFDIFYELIDRRVKSTIVGKDIEQGLVRLAERCKSTTEFGYKQNFIKERENIIQELIELGVKKVTEHPRYISFEEKITVLTLILSKIEKPSELVKEIHELFREDKKAVRLMTLHRSKGLENKRVFMLMNYKGKKLLPYYRSTQEHELIQERNLEFVGITRAKGELVYFSL